MKGLYFVPLLWVFGYLMGDGEFGAKIINGFEWLNTLYLIMMWLVGIMMFVMTAAMAVGGHNGLNTRINAIGAGAGALMMIVAVGFAYFYYWITDKIIMTTDVMATQWSELGSTDLIIMYIVILIIGMLSASRKKGE